MKTIFQFEIQQLFELCMTNFLFELFEHFSFSSIHPDLLSKTERITLVFHDRICEESSSIDLVMNSSELVLRNEENQTNLIVNGQTILERLYSLTSQLVCFAEQDSSTTDEIWSYFGDNFDGLNITSVQ